MATHRDEWLRDEFAPAFDVVEPPEWRVPVIFNSPHSGATYPPSFLALTRLPLDALRRSEDSYVDELLKGVTDRGFAALRAHFPRCYVDVNREPYELDARMFTGRLPSFANTRSSRVAGGLGTIPRVAGEAQEIYAGKLAVDDALSRIETLYKPYHRALRRLVTRAQRQFGCAILIDCHSMPSVSHVQEDARRPDLVIGDRYGTSCAPILTALVEDTFRSLGYSIGRNKPYAGGFITEHYGNPVAGLHTVQLEFNRGIYMDEHTRDRSPNFARVAADIERFAEILSATPLDQFGPFQAAAE